MFENYYPKSDLNNTHLRPFLRDPKFLRYVSKVLASDLQIRNSPRKFLIGSVSPPHAQLRGTFESSTKRIKELLVLVDLSWYFMFLSAIDQLRLPRSHASILKKLQRVSNIKQLTLPSTPMGSRKIYLRFLLPFQIQKCHRNIYFRKSSKDAVKSKHCLVIPGE